MALPECASSSTLLRSFGLCSPSHSPFEMIKAVLGVGVMMCVSSCLLVLSVGDLECVLPNLRKTAHNALLPLAARTCSSRKSLLRAPEATQGQTSRAELPGDVTTTRKRKRRRRDVQARAVPKAGNHRSEKCLCCRGNGWLCDTAYRE